VSESKTWITGVGLATTLGNDFDTFADNLLAGKSGIGKVQRFDVTDHPSQIAGELHHISRPALIEETSFCRLSRSDQLALWCCSEALRDAGLWDQREHLRIGIVLGSGGEWQLEWEGDHHSGGALIQRPDHTFTSLVERTREKLQITGPAISLSAACASGNFALQMAKEWLRLGWVDACLAGACDLSVTPISLASFGNLRALSRRNDNPVSASRPFDQGRDGFVVGEGGAVLLLESEQSAKRRSAVKYAQFAGHGAQSDAHHMVIPCPDPVPALTAMRLALAEAEVDLRDVDYINAHATSTPVGDVAESRVLAELLGTHLSQVPVSSTKSMTGHLLTAAAALEAVACLVALRRQTLPPTINLDTPDPKCPLSHVANQAKPWRTRVALSNSFGFGGSNTCAVFRAA
jgi:3-oxoacyl-[acyl-carrier-protein] synthase II